MTEIELLKGKLAIDKHSLDEELIRQPMLLFEVSEAYVEAAAQKDALKEELATIDAKLDSEIRESLGRIDKKRITEGQIHSHVMVHGSHAKSIGAYLSAKKYADLLAALKEAFVQRGYMLRDLASLHVANYYESSSVQGTSATDRSNYIKTRQKLAEARKANA